MDGNELASTIRALGERLETRAAADPERYPEENIADLVDLGVLTAPLPLSLGGRGLSLAGATEVVLAIAEASPSAALLLSMPLGFAGMLVGAAPVAPRDHARAFEAQTARLAAELRAGRLFAACNSEKGAGGSIAATKTTARRAEDGSHRLTGEKVLASFGRKAQVFFSSARLPDGGVEMFLVETGAQGVHIREDWDGFGMRSTESHSVFYEDAPAREMVGWRGFLDEAQPFPWWWCLFAAIPLGCVATMLRDLGRPAPQSPALRLRLSEALMRYEAARAYLRETAAAWRPGASAAYRMRVTRAKTWVTQESTRLCADLFALSGGRHYTRTSPVARTLADSFAGTALRPPLPLALDLLVDGFNADALDEEGGS